MTKFHECKVHILHPTQITVGLIEVSDKCIQLASMKKRDRRAFLSEHSIPAVRGPKGRLYITDHHHLALAAWHMRVESAFFLVEVDWSQFGVKKFWREMIKNHWAHPIDRRGENRPIAEIPSHVSGLSDDIYRSLAAYVRNAGGFEKTPTAFAEFRWADFFRERVVIGSTRADFDRAVRQAYKLARSRKARELPGYRS
jgi:hypothetical protein